MNSNNLKNLKNRSKEERKQIASKGGKASALKKKEKREIQDLIDILNDMSMEAEIKNFGGIFSTLKSDKRITMTGFDFVISRVFKLLYCDDINLQNERIKATRLLYEMKRDKDRDIEKKKENDFRKECIIKDFELKTKALEIEERKVKTREELIRMKNKGVIDVIDNTYKQLPVNKQLNNRLQEELQASLEELIQK